MLNDYDRSFANPDKLGIGRALETILITLTFIISGILFLRKSYYLFSLFFIFMCGLSVYEIITDNRTYFQTIGIRLFQTDLLYIRLFLLFG